MTKTRPASLKTQNEAYGFYGTISHHANPDQAWSLAFVAISKATGAEPYEVRAFLDGQAGRHFADSVADGLLFNDNVSRAVNEATRLWMGWKISRRTSREQGIPEGLPYLTGFVHMYGIHAE